MVIDFPATRWSLIARLPDQPQQASTLIGLYVDAIGAYVQMRLIGEPPELIEDIIQDVLVELLSKPEALAKAKPGSGSRFRYYVMHLAWQAAINALRYQRRRVHSRLEGGSDDEHASCDRATGNERPVPDQVEAMDRAWAVSVVQQALDDVRRAAGTGQLDVDSFMVLKENLVEGRCLREVAASSGLSLATCSRRLAQARQFLQHAVAERLRLAGEVGPSEDAAAAGDRLLNALAQR